MHNCTKWLHRAQLLPLVLLAACNDGGGSAPAPTPTYSIGGTVSSLTGTVVLQNNGGNDLTISANGSANTSFAFTTKLASGTKYKVTVLTQPVSQTCTASANTGTVSGANITTVSVVCSTITYTISGTVTNLVGSGLVLQNNGIDNLAVTSNGGFIFSMPVASGAGYAVTVYTQPAGRCAVTNGVGIATANITGIQVSCAPIFAYVANFASNDVSAYTVNGSTGALTQVNCVSVTGCSGNNFSAGASPTAVAVAPLAKFAYVANFNSADISAYRIDGSTGALSSVGTTVATGSSPKSVAVDPTGKFVYAVNSGSVSAYSVGATGALTSVGSVSAGISPNSIAIHPNGKFAYVTNVGGSVSAYNISASGALTANSSAVAAGSGAQAVAVDPSGRFAYVANASAHTVSAYTISASGGLTGIGSVAAGTGTTAITVDPSGKFVYAANYTSNDISAYRINAATGALTLIDCGAGSGCNPLNNFMFLAGTNPASITVDPSGLSVYAANDGGGISAYLMDSVSGMLTAIVGSPFPAGTKPAAVAAATTQ